VDRARSDGATALADQRDFERSRSVLFRKEQAAGSGPDSQHREQARGDGVDIESLGLTRARQVHGPPGDGLDLLKRLALDFPIRIVCRRGRASRETDTGGVFPKKNQPVRIEEWQRFEQHGVDDAENRGVGADSERQDQHRERGESRILSQHATRITQVENELIK
jgi:hypothetical protein